MTRLNLLEEDVKEVLQMQGWRVTPEQLISHKKADCLIEKKVHFGRLERVAVECKDHSGALTQREVTEIYANYLPLVDRGIVDYVLLVTREEIAPSAKTFCETARGMMHTTYFTLLNSLIDFSTYAHGMISQYSQDDLDKYYIRQSCRRVLPMEEGETGEENRLLDIEDEILQWIISDRKEPVAVLAGYGMGKTTLAKRIAYVLASSYITDPKRRMPILIRLEDIGSEQSLEGLLGTQFTSRAIVENFNFHVFMELNKQGRFVIILDGFDEMKQAMSWETMRYNFSQLNRLVVPGAKVIMGGRPSAFISEEEYLEAIHGKRRIMGKLKSIPGWPDYRELHLEAFSDEQIRSFVEAYGMVLAARQANGSAPPNTSRLLDQIYHEGSKELLALTRRPVQLGMILEVLPSWDESLDRLTITALYSEFIDLIIRREAEKRARRHFSLQHRRAFARSLAWWMWLEGKGGAVKFSNIPDYIFGSISDAEISLSDLKRDLLGACFLEVKQPEGYYFPHRSFQEFLVAEKLVELLKGGSFQQLPRKLSINAEIQGFIVGLMGRRDWEIWRGKLLKFRGSLEDWVLDLFLCFIPTPEDCIDSLSSPWGVVAAARGVLTNRWEMSNKERSDFLRRLFAPPWDRVYERKSWAKLMVIQALLLRARLGEVKINYKDIILKYGGAAKVAHEFEGNKKVSISRAFQLLLLPEFCQMESWKSLAEETFEPASNPVFKVRKPKPKV